MSLATCRKAFNFGISKRRMTAQLTLMFERLLANRFTKLFITVLAGASLVLAFAPFNYWYLVFPGLIWLVLPLQKLNIRQTLKRGLVFNIGFYGAGISWIHISVHRFGEAPLWLSIFLTSILIFLLSLFSTTALLILNHFFSKMNQRIYFLVALPFSWLFMEWTSTWFLTGFPWLNLAYSQINSPLISLAPLMGSAAISLLIVFIAGILSLLILEGKSFIRFASFSMIFIVGSLAYTAQIPWVHPTDKTLSISLIQPNISQDKKWKIEERIKTLEYFRDTTDTLDAQLVIWPEGAVPALARSVSNYLLNVDIKARKKSQAVLTGIAVLEGDDIYNATLMLGSGEGKYYKQHLLPFGEFVPFESVLRGLIALFDLPMSSFSEGSDDQPLLTVGDWNIAMALCYEIIFQDIVANQLEGADVLITLSNDAWFGDSLGAYQHLEIARMRAIENGVPVIRATNDGISAVIDHRGKIQAKLVKFEKGVLSQTITAIDGKTPFRNLGPALSFLILLSIPALVLMFEFGRPSKKD